MSCRPRNQISDPPKSQQETTTVDPALVPRAAHDVKGVLETLSHRSMKTPMKKALTLEARVKKASPVRVAYRRLD